MPSSWLRPMRLPRERGPLSRLVLRTLTGPVGPDLELGEEATAAVRRSPSPLTDDDVQPALMVAAGLEFTTGSTA